MPFLNEPGPDEWHLSERAIWWIAFSVISAGMLLALVAVISG